MSLVWNVMAMMGAPGDKAGGSGGMGTMFLPMIIIFAIFYFMMIRPQQRKEKERRQLIDNIKSGERVMFSGGIIGTIVNVKEHTFIIRIADNVKVEVSRAAVMRVLEKGEKPTDEEEKK